MFKNKNTILLSLMLLLLSNCGSIKENSRNDERKFANVPKNAFNFILASDFGRNGYYDQKPIAQEMGLLAERINIKFVADAGDLHHYLGIQSVSDPLWMTNYELIYNHPELQVEWLPVLGNHEYHGNTQAVIDYSEVSRRWKMPDRYYTRTFKIRNDASLRIVFIDTTPLIDKYHRKREYPDADKQDMERQLQWIDSVLTVSQETWKIVIGHHPIYAETNKDEEERTDMQNRLEPILRKRQIDFYISGHIHNFQHIRREGSGIDYIVNSSASLGRPVQPIEGTQFCSPEDGFSVVSATSDSLKLYMLDRYGKLLYVVRRGKGT